MTTKSKNLTDRVPIDCKTGFIWNNNNGEIEIEDAVVENFAFTPGKNFKIFVISRFNFEGSIWTLMIHYDEETQDCQIRYGQDSNGNEVNIFLLVPQYVVITIGEVTNPTTPIFLNLK